MGGEILVEQHDVDLEEFLGMVPGWFRGPSRPGGRPGAQALREGHGAYGNEVGGLVDAEPLRPGSEEGFLRSTCAWTSAVSPPGGPLESPTRPGELERGARAASRTLGVPRLGACGYRFAVGLRLREGLVDLQVRGDRVRHGERLPANLFEFVNDNRPIGAPGRRRERIGFPTAR